MSGVFFYKEFNDHDLGSGENPLRKKFNTIVKDLKENKLTYQGSIKLISSKGGIKYLRAKLSDESRLLFTQIKHNNEDVFVILEVIPNHGYENSRFLKSTDKIKSIEIKETEEEVTEKSSDTIEIKDLERAHWLGKLVTFSETQEGIVKHAEECRLPLVISGTAGSGKTSVALESLKKIQEKFEGGKILYITKSENLIKESKKLFECDEVIGESKTSIPKEVEFLSLHKFFEKRIKKDVEGKKPINRNKFFSWFNKTCKRREFNKYKKDGDKIFEEFTAVIAGRVLLKGDSFKKDQYKKLGKRESIFPENERESIYDFFEEYRKFIEKDLKYYDPNLIARECTKEKIYDAIVVDEVQDLTESTLGLILKSLKDESKRNFLLCGDVHQVVHPSFFSLSRLKSFLCQNRYIRNQGSESFYTLKKNYRNSEQVIELANRILHFKNYCFGPEDKLAEDEKKTFFMKSDTKNTGNVSLIAKDEEQKGIAKKVFGSINWAVLVLDNESKEDARKLFNTPLVFNIHEAKGLEFKNVILYKFISNKAYDEIWNRVYLGKDPKKIEEAIKKVCDSYQAGNMKTSQLKDKEDKSLEEYKFYMNALYVAVSRAINNVCIMDDEEKCNLLKVIEPKKKGNVSIENIKKEESSPEEWKNMALDLIDKGNIEQTEDIAKKLLREEKKEYAEEVMDALKAKGYRKEAQEINDKLQSSLDRNKSEQINSELKESCQSPTPQESSMGKSSTPAEESRKRKGQQNQNKEKKSERLEKNTKELFLALENGDLQKAKKLIKKGVDIDATTSEEGDTPLHIAAYNGYENIAGLLLKHEAKVDATSKEGDTPLHLAADKGHKRIIQLLLKRRPNINSTDKDGSTPLFIAAGRGCYDIVDLLLEHGANVDDSNKNGYTPLHVAAQNGCEDVAQLLLRKEANIHATTGKGYTPLHDAAQCGSQSVVKLLLDHGADVNALTKNYITPLLLALQHFHSEVFDLLLADSNINIGYVSDRPMIEENQRDYDKYKIKREQDTNLFDKVREAANERDISKLDVLLIEVEKLLKPENKYGFKPSLNCFPNVGGVTTIEIAIKAGGKLLQLLYDYAEKNIGTDTEIFKRLKQAKEQQENSQPKSNLYDVYISSSSSRFLTQFK